MSINLRSLTHALLACGALACSPTEQETDTDTEGPPAYDWGLPSWVPIPAVPEDNPMTAEKVELGRHLFYDERLSGNGTFSCASCHEQAKAFTDGKPTPMGSTGDAVPRAAMNLSGAPLLATYTWFSPKVETLEQQALGPMFNEFPVELGLTGHEEAVLQRFADDAGYQQLFSAAFPADDAPITMDNIVKAIASFERRLISYRSPYDRYLYDGDEAAMSAAALRGMELFFSERFECYHCHAGFNLTTSFYSDTSANRELDFQNIGLYNLDDEGAYPADNQGLYEFTGSPTDKGKFRPPTLRNVALTAPYMHDGSLETLEDVLEHYAAGGRLTEDGPLAGDGRANPNKSEFVRGFEMTDEERDDVVAFLESFTDEAFVTDPALADPSSG